jgi:predicted MFS family arabinose efflux permease
VQAEATAESEVAQPFDDRITAAERRILAALCLGTFVGVLTFVAPAPFFLAMAHDLRVSVPLLGQVVAAMLLLSAVVGLIAGPLADRFGHRRMIVFGLAATAICFLCFGLAPAFPALLLAALAGGLGNAAVLGPSLAVAGTAFGGLRARRALGWTTAAMAGSAIIGVPILSALGAASGWRTAFLTTSLVVAGIAWLGHAWLPRDIGHAGDRRGGERLFAAYRPLLHHAPTLRLYGVAVLRAICWYGMLTYFGAFLGQRLGLSTGQVGLAYMLGGGGYFLGSLAAGGPLGGVPSQRLLVVGNLAMAVLMGVAYSAVFGPLGSVLMLPLAGATGALGFVAVVTLLTAGSPVGAGTTMTLHGSLFNVGAAVGGALGGLALAMAGYSGLAVVLPIFGVSSALLAWWPGQQGEH